jgi:hypothetical protein
MFLEQNSQYNATALVPYNSKAGTGDNIIAISDPGVLNLANNSSMDITISCQDAKISTAIGNSSDVVAWLGEANYERISNLEDGGLFSLQDSATTNVEEKEQNNTIPSDAYSDMWTYYKTAENEMKFTWQRKNASTPALLVVAQPLDPKEIIGHLSVNMKWRNTASQSFAIPGLSISLIILISCLVLYLVWRSQNAHGRHTGAPKRVVEIISDKTGEYALPFSSITNKTVNKQEMDARTPSLLNDLMHSTDRGIANINPTVPNNDSWRYYGDDSSYASPYYENTIARNDQNFGISSSLNSGSNILFPAPTVGLTTDFGSSSKISAAPTFETSTGTMKLSRKEMRKQGVYDLFDGKKKSKHVQDDEMEALKEQMRGGGIN